MGWNCCKGGGDEETVERYQKTEEQTLKDKFPRLFRLIQRIRENGAPSKLKLRLRRRRRHKNTVRSQNIPASLDPKDNTDKSENTDTVEGKTRDESGPMEEEYDDDDDIICGTIRTIDVLPAPNSRASDETNSTSSSPRSDSPSFCVSRSSTCSLPTCSSVSTWPESSSVSNGEKPLHSSVTSPFMTASQLESVDGVVGYVLERSLANSVSPTFPPLTKPQLDVIIDVRDYALERSLTKSVSPSFPLLTESQLETVNDVTDYVLDKAIRASSCESIPDLVHGVSIPQRTTGHVQRHNGPESVENSQVIVAEGTGDVPDAHTAVKMSLEEDQPHREGTGSTHSTARRRRRKALG